jgi:hypothetical protein
MQEKCPHCESLQKGPTTGVSREFLQNLLEESLRAVEADNAELVAAQKEAARWKAEWEELLVTLKETRESRQWADASYFKVKEEQVELQRRIHALTEENKQLLELANVDALRIALLETQLRRLEKDLKVLHTALLEQGWKGEGHEQREDG